MNHDRLAGVLSVYPTPRPSPTDDAIPEPIRAVLNEAKQCLSAGTARACAVMARRSLQSACIDKGATKDKLVDQIDELAKNGTITGDLREWAHLVRWVANDAAHPGGDPVTREDAVDILKLAEQFLDVVYVTPALAKARKEKRGVNPILS